MRAIIAWILQSYGTQVFLVRGEQKTPVRAFLQLVTSKSWQNMQHIYQTQGRIPRGQYLYIGPADADILQADYLEMNGKHFEVRRADTILVGDMPLYTWGLCVEGGRRTEWMN